MRSDESDEVNEAQEATRTIRSRWALTPEQREKMKGRMLEIATGGKVRAAIMATRVLVMMNGQDQADIHHLEGQKVNLTATIHKSPDEEAADLLAEMRRGDLTPRAN